MNLRAVPRMLAMIPSVLAGVDLKDLEKIKTITRLAYPAVPQISTATLAAWMEQQQQAPLLIDVRSPEEFAVSHLRDALNLTRPEAIMEAIQEHRPARTVLYCSVGYRSSRLAHTLSGKGWPEVMNLEGSIFEWANQGRPVYADNQLVQRVHPYGRRWAGLLKPGLSISLTTPSRFSP